MTLTSDGAGQWFSDSLDQAASAAQNSTGPKASKAVSASFRGTIEIAAERRLKIKWLHDFLALSSEGSFRIASELRGVSQPAFSRRIQALESWVGVALIDRDGPPSQLTEAGKLFLPAARKNRRNCRYRERGNPKAGRRK